MLFPDVLILLLKSEWKSSITFTLFVFVIHKFYTLHCSKGSEKLPDFFVLAITGQVVDKQTIAGTRCAQTGGSPGREWVRGGARVRTGCREGVESWDACESRGEFVSSAEWGWGAERGKSVTSKSSELNLFADSECSLYPLIGTLISRIVFIQFFFYNLVVIKKRIILNL